ncbi:unnamed protein product [Haemonchus placei]|uniref:Protein kinase domain-containing protein n=1 Tax=Haemonchus placei TaxID=6290 RepID=A0A0N4WS49_HAEPC|nr:unnamed protein product [Haemonchus placei]
MLQDQVKADSHRTARELSTSIDANQSAKVLDLKSYGRVQKSDRWILHTLADVDLDRNYSLAFYEVIGEERTTTIAGQLWKLKNNLTDTCGQRPKIEKE